jgi:hypothetical protein
LNIPSIKFPFKIPVSTKNRTVIILELILCAIAIFFIHNAFATNYYDDAVVAWCVGNVFVVLVSITLYRKIAKRPLGKWVTIIVAAFVILGSLQIVLFRLSCRTVFSNSKMYKYKIVYELSENSVLSDQSGNKYILLKIANQQGIKFNLVKSEYADYIITHAKTTKNPYVEVEVFNQASSLTYNNSSCGIPYFIYRVNPLASRLLQIKCVQDYQLCNIHFR